MEKNKRQELIVTPKLDKQPKKLISSLEEEKLSYKVLLNDLYVELGFLPYKFQITLTKLGCLGHNNIICVQPGSGKTLIAAMICKYWAKKLGEHDFHAAFVVSTRKQARQQLDAFKMAGFKVS